MRTIDLHCHGALGHAFDDADEAGVDAAVAYHRAHGSDRVVLSLVSAPIEQLTQRLKQLQTIVPNVRGAVGVHLEGPFLAEGSHGAHDPRWLTTPTPAAVEALLDAGTGILRQITIAPELPGALEAISTFTSAGVVVAVGHTAATYETTSEAFDRGARALTHTFNAMPGLHHRDPGPVGAALQRDDIVLEIIADGMHVHPVLIRTLFQAAPGQIALITDSISATGLGDGDYVLGGLPVSVSGGRPNLTGTSTLAGSTLTLRKAIEVGISAGIAEQLLLEAVTSVPAGLLTQSRIV